MVHSTSRLQKIAGPEGPRPTPPKEACIPTAIQAHGLYPTFFKGNRMSIAIGRDGGAVLQHDQGPLSNVRTVVSTYLMPSSSRNRMLTFHMLVVPQTHGLVQFLPELVRWSSERCTASRGNEGMGYPPWGSQRHCWDRDGLDWAALKIRTSMDDGTTLPKNDTDHAPRACVGLEPSPGGIPHPYQCSSALQHPHRCFHVKGTFASVSIAHQLLPVIPKGPDPVS